MPTKRSIFRWIHLIFAIPIIGYVYSPFEEPPNYAPVVRYVAVPVIALTGLWMWKGHLFRRLIRRSAQRDAAIRRNLDERLKEELSAKQLEELLKALKARC
jgi:hypothetical protein